MMACSHCSSYFVIYFIMSCVCLISAGHGKLLMADGSYYEGEFDKGEINGHGYRFFALSRNVYSGEFHMGEINGQGVMRYANGSTYEGEWENNKRHGR